MKSPLSVKEGFVTVSVCAEKRVGPVTRVPHILLQKQKFKMYLTIPVT